MLECIQPTREERLVQMSKKLFSAEEIEAFRSSPYVESVSERCIMFTPEFKQICYDAYKQGRRMKEILEEHGIDTGAMGKARISGFCEKLERKANREEGFANLRKEKRQKQEQTAETKLELRVRQLEHQLAYAQQEVAFLKKLQQANMEAQKQWESKHRPK